LLASVALLLIIVAWVQVRAGERGLVVRTFQVDDLPLRYMVRRRQRPFPAFSLPTALPGRSS
jgi:hypothetical protein